MNIDLFDVEELTCYLLDINYDDIDDDTSVIENALLEKYGCTIEQFKELLEKLLPMINVGTSSLTNKKYKGFSDIKNSYWFIKTEC
jgi:hypothetical protein